MSTENRGDTPLSENEAAFYAPWPQLFSPRRLGRSASS